MLGITDLANKILYAYGFLTGPPKRWMEPIVYDYLLKLGLLDDMKKSTREMFGLGGYVTFEEELTKMYGDRNLVSTAEDKMARLVQTKSATEYVA